MIAYERWDEGGCYIITDDSVGVVGLAHTKSRNVARRICDALNGVEHNHVPETGLPLDANGHPIPDPPFKSPAFLSEEDVKLILGSLAETHPASSAKLRYKLSQFQWPDYPSMWQGKP